MKSCEPLAERPFDEELAAIVLIEPCVDEARDKLEMSSTDMAFATNVVRTHLATPPRTAATGRNTTTHASLLSAILGAARLKHLEAWSNQFGPTRKTTNGTRMSIRKCLMRRCPGERAGALEATGTMSPICLREKQLGRESRQEMTRKGSDEGHMRRRGHDPIQRSVLPLWWVGTLA